LKKNSKKYLAEGILLLTTFIWGGTFVIIKKALPDISPMLFVTIRFLLATLILFPIAYKFLFNLSKRAFLEGFILGALLFGGFITQTIGLKTTTATKSAFITSLFVVFTPIFQTIIERRIPSKTLLAGIVSVFIGIVFISSKGDSILDIFLEIGSSFNLGDFFTFLCAIIFALTVVYLDIVSKKYHYKFLTFLQTFTTSMLAGMFVFIFNFAGIENLYVNINSNVVIAIIYTSIFATVINILLQTKYQKEVTPTKAGILYSLEPIFATLLAFIILSEQITTFGIIGAIFIFMGLVISEFKKEVD
jgi:drug/metabolite transporter (DMT)-like permease